jgi:hypothetical protein
MATPLYESDFYEWTLGQAATLRRLAAERINTELDLENLAEEVESMAGSDRRELRSRLEIILIHLLKLAYCFYPDPRTTWTDSVQAQRGSLEKLFDQSPSLRRLAPDMLEKAYPRALEQANRETIGLSMDTLPSVNPFPLERVLDFKYIPEPPIRL